MKRLASLPALILFNSCLTIYHKNHVINSNDWGDEQQLLKKNGYYYAETEENTFPYYKNKYGGYSQDSSKEYIQKQIRPYVFYSDGGLLTFGSVSSFQDNSALDYLHECDIKDENTIVNARKHFECDIKHYKDRYPVWGKGVFRVNNKEIKIQYYINWMGAYYLIEKKGEILNDSTFVLQQTFDYKLKQQQKINERYQFQPFYVKPDSTSYLIKHKKKFKQNGR